MRLIDADVLKEIYDDSYCETSDQDVATTIDEQPTIDPVKHGKWREFLLHRESMIFERSSAECSCCGLIVPWYFAKLSDYCIRCGAKMERSEDD